MFNVNLRDLFSKLHLYLGLAAGVVLIVVCVTGSVLVFRPEIESWLRPELLRVEPAEERASLDSVIGAVRGNFPRMEPWLIGAPRAADEVYHIYTQDEAGVEGPEVFVDPYTADVLGSRMPEQSLTDLIFHLHVELLAGERGAWVVGISGIVLLLLCGSGVVLWWPSRRKLLGLKIRWSASRKRVNYDLHRAGGMWTLPFVALVAATGAGLVFYTAVGHALNWITTSPPAPTPPVSVGRPGAEPVGLETALRLAERALPKGQVSFIIPPATPGAAILVRMRLPGELHPNGRSYVYVDPWSGEVPRVENATEAPLGSRMLYALYPLHIGHFGGAGMRYLYAVLGLVPAMLAVSGGVIWWGRRHRGREGARRTRRRRASNASAPRREATPAPRGTPRQP